MVPRILNTLEEGNQGRFGKKRVQVGYSPSKSYYIAYKLTLAIEYPSMKPLCFLLHQGSPNDAKLYDEIMEELSRHRVIKGGDMAYRSKAEIGRGFDQPFD